MDPKHFERIQALFHEAAELPKEERSSHLEAKCRGEEELRLVLAMLEEDERDGSLLDADVNEVVREMLGDAPPAPLPVEELGPYRILGVIEEGGMGVVYLAERADLSSRVAIKLPTFARFSPALRERFVAEQRTLAGLNHKYIARLYDADIHADGTPWFAMEYVDGVKITDYCKGRPVEERLALFRSVCEAVQYAHRHLVVHRDLKPANILVKTDADGATVKLLDFGIAKQLNALDDSGGTNPTSCLMMTLSYAAPEQFRGEVELRTDVYSLGVILYELLTGRLPFDLAHLTPAEAERVVTGTEPEKPSSAARRAAAPPSPRAGSWADLDVLCLKAMHKERERRYDSVGALMRDVDHFLNCEPLDARPDAFGYKLGKFVRRNSRAVAAAAAVFAVILGLVTFFTFRLAAARNEALKVAARKERIQRFTWNLLAGGDKQAGPSEDLRVVTLIDRGVQEARTLDEEPEVQAELYHTLGTSYQNLGFFDRADAQLSAALERRRALYGPDHPEVARSSVALGLLRLDQARLDEAEQLIREGLEKTRRARPPDRAAAAAAVTAFGKLLNARGNYGEAVRVLEEGLKLHADAAAATPEFAANLNQLANAHFYAGNYDASDALNRQVLSINRRVFGEHHILVADDLVNLGIIRVQRGHHKEAEEFYNQALSIVRGWYRDDHPAVASKLILLAQALMFQERYEEAERLLRQALDINERAYTNVHPRVASALNELGVLALRRGRLDEAESHLVRVADIQRAVYGDDNFRTITARSNLATVYTKRNEHARAEAILRDVVERFAKTSPHHLNTGVAHLKLGVALMNQQRYREAEAHTLAGYEIAAKQKSVSWLREARKDLVTLYDALKEPEKAARFRAELEKG